MPLHRRGEMKKKYVIFFCSESKDDYLADEEKQQARY
jgi:hypothetical protein